MFWKLRRLRRYLRRCLRRIRDVPRLRRYLRRPSKTLENHLARVLPLSIDVNDSIRVRNDVLNRVSTFFRGGGCNSATVTFILFFSFFLVLFFLCFSSFFLFPLFVSILVCRFSTLARLPSSPCGLEASVAFFRALCPQGRNNNNNAHHNRGTHDTCDNERSLVISWFSCIVFLSCPVSSRTLHSHTSHTRSNSLRVLRAESSYSGFGSVFDLASLHPPRSFPLSSCPLHPRPPLATPPRSVRPRRHPPW